MSQDARDLERLDHFPERKTLWREVRPGRGKGDDIHLAPWFCYLQGENPDYPRQILEAQWAEVARRMDVMRHDDGDPESWDVHHWQDINPVHTEALIQLTCGGPQIIYHGGLLHTRLRYFDALERRPGLPRDVSALVYALDADGINLTLYNNSVVHQRRLVLQAGAFGEHEIAEVRVLGDGVASAQIGGPHLHVVLPPSRTIDLHIGMRRYVHQPSYSQPSM